jgi:hypothetical protein
MNVQGFKDVSGQEFVAELVDYTTIKNPICLVPTEKGVMPVPYLMTIKENTEITINENALMFMPYDVEQNVVDYYKQRFGGIIEPPSLII